MRQSFRSIAMVMLAVSQAAMAGPFIFRPIYIQKHPPLAAGIRITPNFVLSETTPNQWVAVRRLTGGSSSLERLTPSFPPLLLEELVQKPVLVEQDPAWMNKYKNQSVVPEDPKSLQLR